MAQPSSSPRRPAPAQRADQAADHGGLYRAAARDSPRFPPLPRSPRVPGISTRSIFERFVDLQGLSLATVDYAFAMGEAQAVARNVDGDRPTRLQVARRDPRPIPASAGCRCGASSSPIRASSGDLRDRIRFIRQAIVKRMELMYRPELEVLSRRRAARPADRARSADRLRELGAHARGSWPVVRGGVFGMDAHDRPHAAADASRPPMSGPDTPPPTASSRRWPPPAQRADQAVDHRGLSRACAGELAAGADGGRDRRSRRLLRALGVRALSRHPHLAGRGGRLRPGPGRRPRAGARQPTATGRRASRPRSRRAARAASAGCRCGGRWSSTRAIRPSSSSGSSCRANASWPGWSSCTRRNCRRCPRPSVAMS